MILYLHSSIFPIKGNSSVILFRAHIGCAWIKNDREYASRLLVLSKKNNIFSLPKMNFLGKNLAVVYFSANFAIKIITKNGLK